VGEYRHLLAEHRRAHADGRVRRHMETRLHQLALRFEELLDEAGPGEELQDAWRAHLHRGRPAPAQPAPERPLIFRGVAETGSVVEIRERADGDFDVAVDGTLVERVKADLDFSDKEIPHVFSLDGLVFRETFSASGPALEALDEFVAGRTRQPPWRFASELRTDGLIDGHFSLTPRGHRALQKGSAA
jgi:hypothetical protein